MPAQSATLAVPNRGNACSGVLMDARASAAPQAAAIERLDQIAADPTRAAILSLDDALALLARTGAVREVLKARVSALLAATTHVQRPDQVSPAHDDDRYLTMPEVANRTGLSRSHLYGLARKGSLSVKRMGQKRGYRVLLSDLLAWEAERQRTQRGLDEGIIMLHSTAHDGQRVPSSPRTTRLHARSPR
jgi:excisionase family DNA binding protein